MDGNDKMRVLEAKPPALPMRFSFSNATLPPQSQAALDAPLFAGIDAHAPAGASPAGAWYVLHLRALELALADTGGELLAPGVLADRLRLFPYQIDTARQILWAKRPAAILADEVGLGKTIEAGLVLKELLLRDTVRSVVILAPKALLPQWQEELRERFAEEFVLSDERHFRGFAHEERIICSFQQFVRAFDQIDSRVWDCLIVDEAHLLANFDSKRRRCAAALRAKWRLLLSATPVQNKITDLYSLVDLIRPGRLGTQRQFIAEFAADPATCRMVIPGKAAQLREIAREVMCRTRRDETGIAFPSRSVTTHRIPADPPEEAVIRDVTAYLRALYRRGLAVGTQPSIDINAQVSTVRRKSTRSGAKADRRSDHDSLATNVTPPTPLVNRGALIREIIALQQSLSSSPRAIAASLRARAARQPDEEADLLTLAARCDAMTSAKERLLLDTLRRLGSDPVLIFTLRLETARRLRDCIAASGRAADCYVGELSGDQRRALVGRFNRGELGALIATDAGAEGLNLQERCHVVFNYDLHWNPMKMEQRIGRVHRLGQSQAVRVANFALAGSIDDYVLRLLYEKIDLFTMTIGTLESVLADMQDGELDVEQRILELLLQGDSKAEMSAGLDALCGEVQQSQERLHRAESLTTEVLG